MSWLEASEECRYSLKCFYLKQTRAEVSKSTGNNKSKTQAKFKWSGRYSRVMQTRQIGKVNISTAVRINKAWLKQETHNVAKYYFPKHEWNRESLMCCKCKSSCVHILCQIVSAVKGGPFGCCVAVVVFVSCSILSWYSRILKKTNCWQTLLYSLQ